MSKGFHFFFFWRDEKCEENEIIFGRGREDFYAYVINMQSRFSFPREVVRGNNSEFEKSTM